MCSYGGYHGTFNVTRKCHSIKRGIWSPSKNMCVLKKTRGGTKKMEFNFERGSEVS
jgi:hypothetical protein